MTVVAAPPADLAADKVRRFARDYEAWAATAYTILTKLGAYAPLRLNRMQREVGQAEAEEVARRGEARLFGLKARQGGFSTDQQARSLHGAIHRKGFTALTLADNDKNRDKLFLVTHRAIEHFRQELLPEMGERQVREVGFIQRDSHFWTETAGATTAGRAITLSRLHLSEFAHYEDPLEVIKTATPALVPRGSVAVIETTGGGYDSPAHHWWREARAGKNGYRALFYPWWVCDPANYRLPLEADDELGALAPEEAGLVERYGLALEQIKWRRKTIPEMGGLAEFLQEYAEDEESCWLTAGARYFDLEALRLLGHRTPAPLRIEMEGALEVFSDEVGTESVVIGADVAEGAEGDSSTWSARAFPSWKKLSRFNSNRVAPEEFADLLCEWGMRYGGGVRSKAALLVVEKNAHGITVLRRARDLRKYPEARLYHRYVQDRDQKQPTQKLGWATTAETVPLLLAAGREILAAAVAGTIEPPARATLQDFGAVKRAADGRVRLTGRDDAVAEMLAWVGRSEVGRRPFQIYFPGANVRTSEEEARLAAAAAGKPAPSVLDKARRIFPLAEEEEP